LHPKPRPHAPVALPLSSLHERALVCRSRAAVCATKANRATTSALSDRFRNLASQWSVMAEQLEEIAAMVATE
jgi:hypothetical protein